MWFRADISTDDDDDVPLEIARSSISIECWDNDSFSKTPLGYCHVDFLPMFKLRQMLLFGGGVVSFKKVVELHVPESYGKSHVAPTLEVEVHFTPGKHVF